MAVDYVARFAWTTTDRETGDRYHRFKTIRRSDGVVIGEHIEMQMRWPSLGYGIQRLWGVCDTDRESREMFQLWGCDNNLHQPENKSENL